MFPVGFAKVDSSSSGVVRLPAMREESFSGMFVLSFFFSFGV